MIPRLWLAGGVAAALVLSHGWAYWQGRQGQRLVYERELSEARRDALEAVELAGRKEAERLALEAERNQLALELEDAAKADPDAGRIALPAASVLRLQKR